MHPFRVQTFVNRHFEKGLNHVTTGFRRTRFSGDAEKVATAGDFNIEAAFDLAQMLIKLTAEVGETTVVGGFQDDVLRYLCCVQV